MTRARDVADKNLAVISAGNSGQILTSDGTNWSAQNSPVELPAHGTNGNVLTSDGSQWTSAAPAPTDLVNDTSPQLGADLDMQSYAISNGVLPIKNTGTQSELRLYCEVGNAHYVSLKAPAHSAFSGNHSITLPPNDGNVDQFLKTDGNGVTTWSDIPASGGAWTYLSEVVSTNSTTVDFSNVFTTTYDNYRIVANNVGGNTSDIDYEASLEFSGSTGSYSSYNYYVRLNGNNTSTYLYGGGGVFTRYQNNTGSAAQRANFVVDILNPRSTNAKHAYIWGSGYSGWGNIPVNVIHAFLQNISTTEQTGIRFQASSGTMTGTFRLYGFAKS